MVRRPIIILIFLLAFTGFFCVQSAHAATNVYYSVGQSTSTNLETGSSTVTIASGTAVFSVAQTGNIGVGDQVNYGTSSVAYISAKTNVNDLDWNLVTATGSVPANITNATVTSINRAFSSLAGAIAAFSNASHLATSSLVGANAILNLPCYYDSGADTSTVNMGAIALTTGTSTYVNIYTPNNTSTQANFSQRHLGKWTSNAYQLSVPAGTYAINLTANRDDVRITGLQIELTSTSTSAEDVRMDAIVDTAGYVVLDDNIIVTNALSSSTAGWFVRAYQPPTNFTLVATNNILYDVGYVGTMNGFTANASSTYIYNNTVYDTSYAYNIPGAAGAFISLKNNIAQDDTHGYQTSITGLDASSTSNISDHGDAPGLNPIDSSTVGFVSSSTNDFHLSPFDAAARGAGANLTTDPYYPFSDDIDEQTRPSTGAWDVGADEYITTDTTPPTITAFSMPASSSVETVPVTTFTATDTVAVADYLITTTSSTPSRANAGWSSSAPTSFTFSTVGAQTVYAWAMDTSGNISSSSAATVTVTFPPTNIYYSVGQSTSTNLETGSSTVTIASGTAVFSVAQTGNIGVGDQVTYGPSSTIAYISSKTNANDLDWNLVTATGSVPANITNATVTSINRAFSSLAGALSGFSNASHLATSSLVGANAILNLPCYYDSGPDTSAVLLDVITLTTGTSTYINIYTPNNTSTQANFSQRHAGKWTSNAYSLVVSTGTRIFNFTSNRDDVRVTGLQMELSTPTLSSIEAVRMDAISDTTGDVVLNDNIINVDALSSSSTGWFIRTYQPPTNFTIAVTNNILYDTGYASGITGMNLDASDTYIYNNTVYNTEQGYNVGATGTLISVKNNIAQDDTTGFNASIGGLDASSTGNISDHNDAPGLNPEDSVTLGFVNTSTYDFHLAAFDSAARGMGANLTADPNYPFTDDASGDTRPSSGAWDIGANEYVANGNNITPPSISSFSMPGAPSSTVVSVTSLTATSTYGVNLAYLITQTSTTPSPTAPGWSLSPPGSYMLAATGAQTAYAWVEDAYGNISNSAATTMTITPVSPLVNASSALPAGFFSMTDNNFTNLGTFPSVPVGGFRLWDTHTGWGTLEPSSGTYNWTNLDDWLSAANASGSDVLYTFGDTPAWASIAPGSDCGEGAGACSPPSDINSGDAELKAFATALVDHSLASPTAHIKYYELWNEPQMGTSTADWTYPDLAIMAQDVYTIIKNLDPNAVVLSPSWPGDNIVSNYQSYYAAGAASYQDAVAFHTYNTADNVVIPVTNGIRSVLNQYGIGSEPLIATEGNWVTNSSFTSDQQAAYLAQQYIYLWNQGVSRYYWYAWDNTYAGGLWSASSGINEAGTAYNQLYGWLVGSVHPAASPCYQQIDLTWQCNLILSTGAPAMIMWNPVATKTETVSASYSTYRTLSASGSNAIVANQVSVASLPILLVGTAPTVSAASSGGVNVSGGSATIVYNSTGTVPVLATSTVATTTPTTVSSSVATGTAGIEAEIAQLEAELAALQAQATGTAAPAQTTFSRDLSLWSEGNDVNQLQKFLIAENRGPAAQALAAHGTTKIFGVLTYRALMEFQESVGIVPASGYFGRITRAWVSAHQ